MTYAVKEAFYSLQGEGMNAGRPAVFCRFAGCNLWTGREADRARAVCRFCDTDFVGTDGVGGGRFGDARALAAHVAALWTAPPPGRFVVLTGGEPALQVDEALVEALHAEGFEVAIETNGSLALPRGLDWVCVSPKAGAPLVVREGDELKVVFPQEGIDLDVLASLPFRHRLLQPMDSRTREGDLRGGGEDQPKGDRPREDARARCVARCLADPRWRLSLQTHKILGIR